jgi:hypothetical protein
MKAVIKSYLTYLVLILVIIFIGIISIGELKWDFCVKYFAKILSVLFYSVGTLGFLVNVTTWDGVSKPEKASRLILKICYCLGTFFAILSMK